MYHVYMLVGKKQRIRITQGGGGGRWGLGCGCQKFIPRRKDGWDEEGEWGKRERERERCGDDHPSLSFALSLSLSLSLAKMKLRLRRRFCCGFCGCFSVLGSGINNNKIFEEVSLVGFCRYFFVCCCFLPFFWFFLRGAEGELHADHVSYNDVCRYGSGFGSGV